nr:ATP-binding protein [Colwellia sp. E2M01]
MALQETSAKHQRDYALLRSVMNAIPELIVFNDNNGLLIGCNNAFERLTKHSVEQMLGEKSVRFMPPELAAEINRLNALDDNTYPQSALIKAGDFTYQGFCNQFTDEQGNVLGSISLFHDVTVQQATQSALKKAKDQAEYANRVKIQFLANMSHEVRTPINAMQGMMDLLARTSLDTRQEHYLINAQSASTTLLHLVDELLDLSKIEAGKMVVSQAPVNLANIIDKALKLNMSNINHQRVEMLVDMSATVPSNVISDEMRLVQVLANLFNNAIKFTEQGYIKLIVDTLLNNESHAQVRFRVIDTGIGIAKENQSHLFTAFSQADESMTRKYGGSGLGLSICQQIIKLLGGKITLTSQLGEGSELSFILPLEKVALDKVQNKISIAGEEINDFSQAEFTRLSADLAHPLVDSVTVYSVKQKLTESFIHSIKQMNWYLYEVDDIQELLSLNIAKASVLLIGETHFSQLQQLQTEKAVVQSKSSNLFNLTDFKLLALSQPALTSLHNETCRYLDKLEIPYLLVDLPLFRYALDQISKSLFNLDIVKKLSLEELKPVTPSFVNSTSEKQLINKEVSNTRYLEADIDVKQNPKSAIDDEEENLKDISVLLVEDNLINQLVAKELLSSMQAIVTIVDNGQAALDILEKELFDVVLMDIQMPIMDGLTATKQLRKQSKFKYLPIIAMTAHARAEDKEQSFEAGMNYHMAKPVTGKVLLSSIKEVLMQSKVTKPLV